ncbi:hypothetical protein BDV11DRAFT_203218 [Aspergillus similis]
MVLITLDPTHLQPPTRGDSTDQARQALPSVKNSKAHPYKPGGELAEWQGVRILTDPNFLHAGDHVHLGPGLTSTRMDHFDREVETSLRRDLPIVTTSHAKSILTSKEADSFANIHNVDHFYQMMINIANRETDQNVPSLQVTGMPGKHVPLGKPMGMFNDIIGAFPPVNGWMLELGYGRSADDFNAGYRIYISGDTLLVNELKEIPRLYDENNIDMMTEHLGATMVPSLSLMPFTVMATMNAEQGVELMQLVKPDITTRVHFNDCDVMSESIEEFKLAVEKAGLSGGVVYLDRGEEYRFRVRR